MGSFETMLIIGVALLFVSLIFANEGLPAVCSNDTLVCPDGTVVRRDPLDSCEFFACPNLEYLPYCSESVDRIEVSDGLIRTVFSSESDGFSVYGVNSSNCPDVSPSIISNECRNYADLKWVNVVNCSSVSYWFFNCTEDAFVRDEYVWINCEPGLFPEFEQFCEPSYSQWIELNCDIDIIR